MKHIASRAEDPSRRLDMKIRWELNPYTPFFVLNGVPGGIIAGRECELWFALQFWNGACVLEEDNAIAYTLGEWRSVVPIAEMVDDG